MLKYLGSILVRVEIEVTLKKWNSLFKKEFTLVSESGVEASTSTSPLLVHVESIRHTSQIKFSSFRFT
jgi:hypothetical protein